MTFHKNTQITLLTNSDQVNDKTNSIRTPLFDELPPKVVADLRTDHAGEVGAVNIYKGVLFFARDPKLRAFAERHLATEESHLALIKEWLMPKHYSHLLPLWRISGFLTGALPALFGARAVYATIEVVETFVDQHYEHQVQTLELNHGSIDLLETLKSCQADEVSHRNEAALARGSLKIPLFLACWCAVVSWGSRIAVTICRYI